ncbi:O-antigen ligase family protein [soil metagenome]
MIRLTTVIALVASAMAMLFPALMFGAPNLANAAYSLLLVCAIVMLATQPRVRFTSLWQFIHANRWLCAAFVAVPLAVWFHEVWVRDWPPAVPYTYKRIGLFIVMTWLLMQLPLAWLRAVRFGWMLGAAIAAIWITRMMLDSDGRQMHIGFSNLIPFGDLSMMMGVLALLSIGWTRSRVSVVLGVLAGLLGLYVSVASGNRGSWLAIPIFIFIALFLTRRWSTRVKFGVYAAVIATLVLLGAVSRPIAERVERVDDELTQFEHGENLDSSVGTRLQLWQASWRIFQRHPVAGTGVLEFKDALHEEAAQNRLTPVAATFDHSHNEVLFALASLGVVGLLAYLMLLVVPAVFYARRLRADNPQVRCTAAMGLTLCTGFAVFGLTEVLTIITLTNAFYTITSAVLAADILQQERLAPSSA